MMEDLIKKWARIKNDLALIKQKELELREIICHRILGGTIKGTKTITAGLYTVSASAKLNTKIDNEELCAIWQDLSQLDKDCIEYKPKLIAKNYKGIDEKSKLHRVIITKPGTPTLTLKKLEE